MKKVITLTETELRGLIKRIISETKKEKRNLSEQQVRGGTFGDIMSLQSVILGLELEKGVANFIEDGTCKKPHSDIYGQGEPKQCKISGSTLCKSGESCYQSDAIDGIFGPLTKAALEKYKNEKNIFSSDEFKDKTLEQLYGTEYTTDEKWSQTHSQNWQIPAEMDNIKAFQYFVWKFIEKDNEKDPNCTEQPCAYKTILCGDSFCKRDKAVDGFWGKNTKLAWNKYKENYFDEGWDVGDSYENVFNHYKNI